MALLSGYLAIGSAFTAASGALTELSGNGYARPPVTLNYDAVAMTISGNATEFGPATGTWTAGVEIAVYDALTGGNLLFAFPAATLAIVSGASMAIPGFTVQLTAPLSTATPFPALTTLGTVLPAYPSTIIGNNAAAITGTAKLALSTAGALSASSGVTTLTDGATITANCAASSYFSVTIAATGRTLTLANGAAGQVVMVEVVQDGTGSRTITTYTNVNWASGTAPTLTTTAAAIDVLRFTYNSARSKWIGETVAKAVS